MVGFENVCAIHFVDVQSRESSGTGYNRVSPIYFSPQNSLSHAYTSEMSKVTYPGARNRYWSSKGPKTWKIDLLKPCGGDMHWANVQMGLTQCEERTKSYQKRSEISAHFSKFGNPGSPSNGWKLASWKV